MNQAAQATSQSDDGDQFDAFRKKVEGTNINRDTLLATDYLNHFNEIVMLLEMLPDMPDIFEDAREWRPKTYKQHFEDSNFTDRELAIAAYDHVPENFRLAFEGFVSHMDRIVASSLAMVAEAIAADDQPRLRDVSKTASDTLKDLINAVATIIRGHEVSVDQHEIDDLFTE